MTTENWREEFEIVWQMSVDHISDNRAGCYGKMDMVKKEMGGFISTLLSKERNKVIDIAWEYVVKASREEQGSKKEMEEFIIRKLKE